MDIDKKDLEIFSYEGSNYQTRLTDKFRNHKPYEPEDLTRITAQIPGTMLKVLVKEGQYVNPTKCLFILEAMKMKNKIFASISGRIKKIHVTEGQIVTKNQLLLELGESESLFKKLLEKPPAKAPRGMRAAKTPKAPKRKAKSRKDKKSEKI